MSVEFIRRPDGLAEPLGKYSNIAHGTGRLVAVAGQVGVDADGLLVGDDMLSQLRRTYFNLGCALAAVGAGYTDVVKMTTFLVGPDSVSEFMSARAELFDEIYPAGEYPPNTLVMVSGLVQPGLQVEVEAFALVGGH